MSRSLRINYPNTIYHVINRRLTRNKIVNEQRDYLEFFKTLSKIHDVTLNEVAQRFEVRSYGVVGWSCNGIRKKIESNRAFKRKMERIYQQKILPLDFKKLKSFLGDYDFATIKITVSRKSM